jgi:hypothetical protein
MGKAKRQMAELGWAELESGQENPCNSIMTQSQPRNQGDFTLSFCKAKSRLRLNADRLGVIQGYLKK